MAEPDTAEPRDFVGDTALQPLDEPGAFSGLITERWWIVTGPNGGLLAGMLLRAVLAHVSPRRPELAPRIVTVQYLSGPQVGPVELQVSVDKDGRRVVFASVVMTQAGKVLCQAKVTLISALSDEFEHDDHVMPAVPPPERCPILDPAITYGNARHRWQRRDVAMPAGAVAAWMRLEPPVPIDATVMTLLCDNLPPSLRSHHPAEYGERIHTTTIELTVYLRRATYALAPSDECLLVLRSATVTGGLHQEEGEVWSADGRLLATSRQLALVFLRPPSSTSSSDS